MNFKLLFFIPVLLLFSKLGYAEIKLPRLISDGAILQRDIALKIWGWADPNEGVELTFEGKNFKTTADKNGDWNIMLPAQKAGGPYMMVFKGENEITIRNILFGEVWLCSGQSNMELTMERLKDTYPDIIKSSKNKQIRQFLVPDKYDFNNEHKDLDGGNWKEANPENLLEFSGVAYFFASELFEKYHVPIGLINAALGGSPVEAWMSEDALSKFPEAFDEMIKFKSQTLIDSLIESDGARQEKWYNNLNKSDQGLISGAEWFSKDVNDDDWQEMEIPNFWKEGGIEDIDGVVWFRKTIVIPKRMEGKKAKLWLGRIVDQDFVYVNGTYVGTTGYQYPPRKYVVPDNVLKAGENTITVRVINNQGEGGFILDKPYFISSGLDSIDLKGNWKYKIGASVSPLQGPTFIRWKPGGLYNHMIAPLTQYKIKGVIWFQGESNTANPASYFATFPALIDNWRDKWQIGIFPFLFVQLANFMEETPEPTESKWAELRQAQLQTLALKNTGMAVTIDIGEWNDIHPLNKQEVGDRLAQLAFRLAYNEKNTDTSPIPKKSDFQKKVVVLTFEFANNGLKSKNNKAIEYFEISNDGTTFFKANATMKGNKVVVWNDKISNPSIVRYAWADNPARANLISINGLPVSPFEVKKE